jgi:Fanconi anemia group M protein
VPDEPAEPSELRIKPREYQTNIAVSACKQNTLVILPTGLGKTIIAMLVAELRLGQVATAAGTSEGAEADRLEGGVPQGPGMWRVLVMAPTKPLTVQHRESFRSFFASLSESSFRLLTGDDDPQERRKVWKGVDDAGEEEKKSPAATRHDFIFATPETVRNDLKAGRASLGDFALLVFDEAHRCVGDYSYVEIARTYMKQASKPLILGLTASPGSTEEKVEEVMANLRAVKIEARTEQDEDVAEYVQETKIRTVKVKLPDDYKRLVDGLRSLYYEKVSKLRRFGLFRGEKYVTKKTLLASRREIAARLHGAGRGSGYLFGAMLVQSQAVMILHAMELAETQGLTTLSKYLEKLRYGSEQGRSAKALFKDERWVAIEEKASALLRSVGAKGKGRGGGPRYDHPKMEVLLSLIREQLDRKPQSKIIVFTQYRDTIDTILSVLSQCGDGRVRAQRFVGQSVKSEKDRGMNQKLQTETLERFAKGEEFDVLVSSSIGEEGLHVPDVDLVVFYEAVPSAIRSIQRKGRTGRTMPGSVVILISEGTVDESYYRSTVYKEKMMKKVVESKSGEEEEDVPDLPVPKKGEKSDSSPTLLDFMG